MHKTQKTMHSRCCGLKFESWVPRKHSLHFSRQNPRIAQTAASIPQGGQKGPSHQHLTSPETSKHSLSDHLPLLEPTIADALTLMPPTQAQERGTASSTALKTSQQSQRENQNLQTVAVSSCCWHACTFST